MTARPRLFVFGLGYSAVALARAMANRAAWVGGTVRTSDKALALGGSSLHTFVYDGTGPESGPGSGPGTGAAIGTGTEVGVGVGIEVAAAVRDATHLLISIAPGQGDPVLADYHQTIAAAPHLRWIGYLSTVGVYGDHGGERVDESTPPRPGSQRSGQRLAAEEGWRALANRCGAALAIFRLAGIYGPGRNALANLEAGRARRIVKPGQVFNRIHVDDIVTVLMAAIGQNAHGIFNVADDEPAPPQDVVAHAAALMGREAPPEIAFESAELSPMARSFYGENKRVANTRVGRDLAVALRYPTYREGLAAMWRDGTWQGET